MQQKNRLAQAASSYLRSAQDQPVDWHEWSDEAFARAQREDKPVLLDVGATWCHWCHVMDRESYEDADTAALINAHFVAIKVDRDERPDVDTRYQAAVAAISGQGGWPLTAFLTPAGRPYFGGTYFPAGERVGRPSFRRVLHSMAEAYRSQRADVEESGMSVVQAVEENESFTEPGGVLNEALLDSIIGSILEQFDPRHGGFGSQPKFPQTASLALLLDAAARGKVYSERAAQAVGMSLESMAAGGMHDQLAGGFHRYSVDEAWVVPHFEKMAYDNAELLRVYSHAAHLFPDGPFAQTATTTLQWMDAALSDREQGGFFASQDADASLDDHGDYFTWTRAEAQAELSPAEFAVAERSFHLRAVGHMQHNPAKNVLGLLRRVEDVAAELQVSREEAATLLGTARGKLLVARARRQTPFVDRTLYTGWNGLCISAYLAAARALALPDAEAFALRSLHRALTAAWKPGAGLLHVIAYGEAPDIPARIPAVLEDYAFLGAAALDAWEATGDPRWFQAAQQLADYLLEHFYDNAGGGFFDTEQGGSESRIGALTARRKPVQDTPTPSGNAVAATLLLRLHALTEYAPYRERATETLEVFAGVAEHLGLYVASYAQALQRWLTPPVQVLILGDDQAAHRLAAAATARFGLYGTVIRLRTGGRTGLPTALAASEELLSGVQGGSVAIVCRHGMCMPPVRTVDELMALPAVAD